MSDGFLIKAEGVSKKYCRNLERSLRYGLHDVLCELRGKPRRSSELRLDEFWSLKDVSFELGRGEALALLGRNGAGKSTLLQLLNGRLKLDEGRITVRGTTGLVTELGAGFNPTQTGRENVYNSGAVLGMSRGRIEAVYGDIVEFAELRNVMETPVQTYSSGMRARLGFSVVAHLRPDALLADEVLAVGDIAFRRKCIQHMVRYMKAGGTLILVAHDVYYLQSIATRCIVMEGGRAVFDGPAREGFSLYYAMMRTPAAEITRGRSETTARMTPTNGGSPIQAASRGAASETASAPEAEPAAAPGGTAAPPDVSYARPDPTERQPVVIDTLRIHGENGGGLRLYESAVVELRYRSRSPFKAVSWGFSIHTTDQQLRIATGVAGMEDGRYPSLRAGDGVLTCRIKKLPLVAGTYALSGAILDIESKQPMAELGREEPPIPFTVAAEADDLNNLRAYLGNIIALETEFDAP